MKQTPPPTLDYSERTPLAWISRHRRLLVFLALVISIAIPIWWYWTPLKYRVLWLYWSRQAAAHVMPPSVDLVIGNDQISANKAVAANPEYVMLLIGNGERRQAEEHALYQPLASRRLRELDSRFPPNTPLQPVAFMGTLRRPDGVPRLVVVLGSRAFSWLDSGTLDISVMPIPGLFDTPPPLPPPIPLAVHGPVVGGPIGFVGAGSPASVESRGGIVDPNDASHVIFPYLIVYSEIGWINYDADADPIRTHGEFEGYLQNDDTMRFNLRSFKDGPPSK